VFRYSSLLTKSGDWLSFGVAWISEYDSVCIAVRNKKDAF